MQQHAKKSAKRVTKTTSPTKITTRKTTKRSIKTKAVKKPSKKQQPLFTVASKSMSTETAQQQQPQQFKYLDVQRKGAAIHVTMNRPDVHNAFNEDVIKELTDCFKQIESNVKSFVADKPVADKDPNGVARCVVLTGAGRSFSAGADLNWMKKMSQYTEEQNKQDSLGLYDMFYSIYSCPIPVIARVNGAALGGGAGLVAASDIAIAVEASQIGFTEVAIGLVPAVISRFCTQKIGPSNAARYFVTGERFGATEAKRIGLVHEVFSTMDEVDAQVNKLVATFDNNSPNAVRGAKKLWQEVIGGHHQLSKPETRDFTASTIAAIRVSPEGQAGLNSFLTKQPAPWKIEKM